MKKLITGALLMVFFTGCTSSGAFLSANQTIVNLNQGNYTITATDIAGEAEADYIFGVSYSNGLMANTFAIARVGGTGTLYADALNNLWQNYETDHGISKERKLALTNIRYDSDILNLFFYTKVKITVRADIIEFE